jgi:hypothetical protein
MAFVIRECLIKAVVRGWDVPMILAIINIKANTRQGLEKAKAFLRAMMGKFTKAVGVTIKFMGKVERSIRAANAF